jgi:hypothetical protein
VREFKPGATLQVLRQRRTDAGKLSIVTGAATRSAPAPHAVGYNADGKGWGWAKIDTGENTVAIAMIQLDTVFTF